MRILHYFLLVSFVSIISISCTNETSSDAPILEVSSVKELTIFHINDQHGRLANFAKIKSIIDQEKSTTNVMVVCAGDIFSGNPVVDNHEEKGFPMIDLMNKVGFDVAALGNHEFDYGEAILKDRFLQSQFSWVCANVDMKSSGIPEPFEYKTITKNNVSVTFLGLVETNGKQDAIIPSTHPWRVQNLTFKDYQDVIVNYENIKENEKSDLYIALTHLGESTDTNIATSQPYFDLIIGGHSHTKTNKTINNTRIFHAGSNLNFLGKIKLTIENKNIETINFELINLEKHTGFDSSIKELVDNYNESANLSEVIGFAQKHHSKSAVGAFYTEALRVELEADITFQNTGGVRNDLNEGDILKSEIYSIDPFNNGSVTYSLTVGEIKDFLMGSKLAIYYSGVEIEQENGIISIYRENQLLADNTRLVLGMNDYIPAVYDTYFTQAPTYTSYTTAERIINYLKNSTETVNYTEVDSYFKFE